MVVWGETLRRKEWSPPPMAVATVILVGVLVIVPSFAAFYMLLAGGPWAASPQRTPPVVRSGSLPRTQKAAKGAVSRKKPVRRGTRGR